MLDSGSPPEIGGYADASLVETVLRRREPFRGMLESGGRRVLVACRPIFGPQAEEYGALGMIEAFQDLHSFYEVAAASLRESGMGLTGHSQRQEQADRIGSVMEFIDDVSRRLQLLALNGNIIAAQAGDHGRAFRVVCRELSSLADQSKDAVAEVRKLSEEIAPPAEPEVAEESIDARVSPTSGRGGRSREIATPPVVAAFASVFQTILGTCAHGGRCPPRAGKT